MRTRRLPPRPDIPWRPDVAAPPPLPRHRRRAVIGAITAFFLLSSVLGVVVVAALDRPAPAFDFLARHADGSPYRWNPCAPIHYVVNLEHAPPQAEADLTEALRRVTEANGIAFVNDGTTTRTDEEQRSTGFTDPITGAWLPVLVTWQTAEQFRDYANPRRYAGIGMPYTGFGADAGIYRSGMVVINADTGEPTGFVGRFSEGPLLMHEWGHVLGLAHVGSARELMWSDDVKDAAALPDLGQEDWGAGDREGLAEVGRAAGCLPAASSPGS